jgi:NAD(P)-dependent dehydrogenase (short-subunit alcohol dehydrogenase family)
LLVARSQGELDDARAELTQFTSEVRATALDLTVPDAARRIVGEAAETWGGLDVLITNAASPLKVGLELDDDLWAVGFGLKVFANLRVIKHAWPLLKRSTGHLGDDRWRDCTTTRTRTFVDVCRQWGHCSTFKVHC